MYDFNATHLNWMRGTNNTYLSAEPVIMVNGSWEVDQDKSPYPLNSSMFPVMADFDTWVGQCWF